MRHDPEEPPVVAFDRYLRQAENSPEARARQERIRRSAPRRFSPWRDIPPIGLTLVVLLLLARWLAGLVGLA